MVELRRVTSGEWEQVRAIRLEMLQDTPDAYITTLEEAKSYPDSIWIDRAAKSSSGTTQTTILGFEKNIPVAMAVGMRRSQNSRDVLVIVSVYVTPSHRGTGLAADLMAKTEDWGQDWGAPLASLWVAEANKRARAFYDRIGYQPTGDRTRMKPNSDAMELRLEKPL